MVSDGFQPNRQNGTHALVAATIFPTITGAGVICRILKIDLTYDSASPSATVLGDIAVSLVVLLFALSL